MLFARKSNKESADRGPPKHSREWKSHKRARKVLLPQSYTDAEGRALSLVSPEYCQRAKCHFTGQKKFMVKGRQHRLAYLTRHQREKLPKRKYTRVITDKGEELFASDKSGHHRRIRAY